MRYEEAGFGFTTISAPLDLRNKPRKALPSSRLNHLSYDVTEDRIS